MRDITPRVVVDFRAALLTDGIGVPAVRKTMAMLQGVFSREVEWEEATTNPFAVVRKPRAGRQRVIVPLTPALVEAIRARLLAERDVLSATLVSVLAYAGLRPEEALALQPSHIRARTLLVQQANANGTIKEIKNGQLSEQSTRSTR